LAERRCDADMRCQGGDVCKKARLRVNMVTENASESLNLSSRMLGRYEAGEYIVPEDVLIRMAELYNDPLLPWNYWAVNSLIAKQYGIRPIQDVNFSAVALRVINGLNKLSNKREDFAEIISDEMIEPKEKVEFEEIIAMVESVSQGVTFLKLTGSFGKKEKPLLREAAV
jgi:transcriptional regulator with XRE-family HTH domain